MTSTWPSHCGRRRCRWSVRRRPAVSCGEVGGNTFDKPWRTPRPAMARASRSSASAAVFVRPLHLVAAKLLNAPAASARCDPSLDAVRHHGADGRTRSSPPSILTACAPTFRKRRRWPARCGWKIWEGHERHVGGRPAPASRRAQRRRCGASMSSHRHPACFHSQVPYYRASPPTRRGVRRTQSTSRAVAKVIA